MTDSHKSMRQITLELCTNVREIYNAPNLAWRVLWALVFIASLCVCLWSISILLMRYIEGEVITSYSRINREKLQFPQVTVCTFSRLNATKLKENYNPPPNLISYILSVFDGQYSFYNDENLLENALGLEVLYQDLMNKRKNKESI